jgi:hypothetical protein
MLGEAAFRDCDDEPEIGSLNPGLDAASWNCGKRRTLSRPGDALNGAVVLFSNAAR